MKIGAIIQIWYGAIAIYDTVLKFAPNDLKTLKRKGFALEKLSKLQLSQQQYTEAIKALKQAIASSRNTENAMTSYGKLFVKS
ncbi:MAG: hypothetical protein RM049_37740 [Nostoc sp. DedQUE04]|uniref:hypothetical protein n=1 Tax=Nostoc sp. DedQUE04 TaxID=3075390 RepID=UPI002AD31F48|nr:hypothetical protein [Nostoc sp. DedQUE04]MDZ8140971.1 hypothetical protein [Nostoc sp. DedQUE04]